MSEEYLKADAAFRERLSKGRDHYLKLVGLHKLVLGTNLFGDSDANNIQLSSEGLPATIGAVELAESNAVFTASDSLEVRLLKNDSLVAIWTDEFTQSSENGAMLKHQHLEWQVIKRVDEYFLRVKDQNSALAKAFKGFEAYPLQSSYVVEADYRPFAEFRTEEVNTQLGTNQQMDFAGILSFELKGQTLELSVGDGGFLIVGDMTNDETTYGGGRYVYVELPDSAEKVTIDFNRLYNPPCVYSEFTTCPLPPVQNVLPLEILAGEKYAQL
ncbi:DUF1684 domain-containing protein [Reichenbachiella faecimaris]|uniref:DUF1684 domain-containing protein n=1 Tax=Reichenbachiella faecimaris TaxID=692418 RepID=UPI0015932AD8|nr:DUF1684 domain-containing protein [Reichenbachiella faecimaris]